MNTNYAAFALIIIILIIGGWWYISPKSSGVAPAPRDDSGQTVATTSKAYAIVVAHGKLVSGPNVISVTQGDNISLTIMADQTDELHLHGYDLHTNFSTGTPASITFKAAQSGRFPFEIEGTKTQLGEVDVAPK